MREGKSGRIPRYSVVGRPQIFAEEECVWLDTRARERATNGQREERKGRKVHLPSSAISIAHASYFNSMIVVISRRERGARVRLPPFLLRLSADWRASGSSRRRWPPPPPTATRGDEGRKTCSWSSSSLEFARSLPRAISPAAAALSVATLVATVGRGRDSLDDVGHIRLLQMPSGKRKEDFDPSNSSSN